MAPQWLRPGSRRCPGFARKKLTVRLALTAAPSTAPLSPETPDGKSMERIGVPEAFARPTHSAASPSSTRDRPAPKSPSTMRENAFASKALKGSLFAFQAARAFAASPLRLSGLPSAKTRTENPIARKSAAAT